jgi:hypothetical protein
MPRVIVIADASPVAADASVWLNEHVRSVHLSTDHAAAQFLERLAWAVSDAEDADEVRVEHRAPRSRQPRRSSPAARSRAQRRVRA